MQHLSTLLDWIRYATSRLAIADIAYGHGTDTLPSSLASSTSPTT